MLSYLLIRKAYLKARLIAYLPYAILLTSCAAPAIKLTDWTQGLTTEWLTIGSYNLVVLEKQALNSAGAIHIYIEGDGTPWLKRFFVARNPTPSYPLALELMKRDTELSLYVGRPCYYQDPIFYYRLKSADTGCNFHYWTDGRYSPKVVQLLSETIQQKINSLPPHQQALPIILIGHSGGGSLAMLVSQHLPSVSGIITIAANMDTDAWTKHQGYSPLKNSLNPAKQIFKNNVPQVHFAGTADRIVPPEINLPFLQKSGQTLILMQGFTHGCCWLERWPELLNVAYKQLREENKRMKEEL